MNQLIPNPFRFIGEAVDDYVLGDAPLCFHSFLYQELAECSDRPADCLRILYDDIKSIAVELLQNEMELETHPFFYIRTADHFKNLS